LCNWTGVGANAVLDIGLYVGVGTSAGETVDVGTGTGTGVLNLSSDTWLPLLPFFGSGVGCNCGVKVG